jgi:hypothetical protein
MFESFDRVVRCSDGHLFTTRWVPYMSFKAVRLGSRRWQRCPVGGHWTTVTQVDVSTLSAAELTEASAVHDIAIP